MRDKKKRIDIYKTIWDIDIVIANKYVTLEDLKDDYECSDSTELDNTIEDGCASTSIVRNKKTKALCCLVKYNRRITRTDISYLLDSVNTAVHEAVHVLLDIYEQSDVKIAFDNQEPLAYELGDLSVKILKTILDR